jgi:hypothetical protein
MLIFLRLKFNLKLYIIYNIKLHLIIGEIMEKIKFCWNCGHEVPYQKYADIDYVPKCDICGSLYPEKPKDEALLSIYQDEYLKNRSDKNLNRLFDLMSKVTFNVICYKLKCTSSYEEIDDIWDKVQWTLEKLIKYYKEKPDFKITTSFVQYIGQVILYPLYNKDARERQKKEISIYTPKFNNTKDKKNKELFDYLSSDTDGGINEIENTIDYNITQNYLVSESTDYINTVIQSLYDYEVSEKSKHAFRSSLYMAQLYKYFISGEIENKIVTDIMNSLDFTLIKKFNASRDIYKNILMKHIAGN